MTAAVRTPLGCWNACVGATSEGHCCSIALFRRICQIVDEEDAGEKEVKRLKRKAAAPTKLRAAFDRVGPKSPERFGEHGRRGEERVPAQPYSDLEAGGGSAAEEGSDIEEKSLDAWHRGTVGRKVAQQHVFCRQDEVRHGTHDADGATAADIAE